MPLFMPFTATNANIEKDQPFVLVSLNKMLLRETRRRIADESDAPAAGSPRAFQADAKRFPYTNPALSDAA
jgi:hypothetical protein